MKNQLKFGVLLIAVALGSNQEVIAQEVEFGIKAGALYSMPSYGNNNVKDNESKIGAQAGVFLRAGSQLYIQPELTVSMFKANYSVANGSYDPTFYELNLPVQVGYKILEDDDWTLRASLGPQINYNLKNNKAVGNEDYKDFNFDALVNVGVDIKKFTIDLRYNQGLSKTSKELDSKNRTLGLSFGYKF